MTAVPAEDELRAHNVFVKADNPFQRTVRLRQALWREKQGYPACLCDPAGEIGFPNRLD